MSQVNDDWDQVDEFCDPILPVWDGPNAYRRTFIQDAAVGSGNIIAVWGARQHARAHHRPHQLPAHG